MQSNTITVTFGDVAESYVGMEKLGTPSKPLTMQHLENIHALHPGSILHRLNDALPTEIPDQEEAGLLILPKMLQKILLGIDTKVKELESELLACDWDKKALSRGRVVTKRARYNLVFGDKAQEPRVQEGKGRIIAFETLPLLAYLRNWCIGLVAYGQTEKPKKLYAEGNLYFHNKAGIGFHGDRERNLVIGIRLGGAFPLVFHWYHQCKRLGKRMEFNLHDGDIYLMSGKAVGSDWRKSSHFTLRHAAGAAKYTS